MFFFPLQTQWFSFWVVTTCSGCDTAAVTTWKGKIISVTSDKCVILKGPKANNVRKLPLRGSGLSPDGMGEVMQLWVTPTRFITQSCRLSTGALRISSTNSNICIPIPSTNIHRVSLTCRFYLNLWKPYFINTDINTSDNERGYNMIWADSFTQQYDVIRDGSDKCI